ncbi:hypothetical protein H2200_001047 [Cladophialophora chaetospira]|uniref:Xylanolytic transcriptional activator regulatory domain-containing protein n=1 Tax=Cladophialophora chaetospira TaxID=386627 RepID=A0AA38XK90_9EURO|nr:hypothetical protein H2200_001047 [Cladophialophora chaetospira]
MPCSVCVANAEECIYRSNQSTQHKQIADSNGVQPPTIPNTARGLRQSQPDHTNPRKQQEALPAIAPAPPKPQSVHSGDIASQSFINNLPNTSNPHNQQAQVFAPSSFKSQPLQEQPFDDLSSEEEPSPQGFGETNSRTNGREFYGPAATLVFLLELRYRARLFRRDFSSLQSRPQKKRTKSFLVNLMDGEDEEAGASQTRHAADEDDVAPETPSSNPTPRTPAFFTSPSSIPTNEAIEKECISRYFANMNVIYYVLEKAPFLTRCEKEIWSKAISAPIANEGRHGSRFPALYSAVVALGALTSGDDIVEQSSTDARLFWEALAKQSGAGASSAIKHSLLPRELAYAYFARARGLLGDFFEACSLETQQTLFFLSVFCQYALKPHSCYMYNGMAIRTAMAIGSSNLRDFKKNPVDAIRTWWCMYYHEVEVCSLLGRETVLRDPNHYPVFLARFGDPIPKEVAPAKDDNLFFARSNTELARLLRQISEAIYHTASPADDRLHVNRHQAALNLDAKLVQWKKDLKPVFDLSDASLTERESVTKRKIILQLRYHSARIMIHRPFLVTAACQQNAGILETNVRTCLDAARETVELLYHTFINRTFIRTWWYNTTYAFNAASVILYVLVTGLHRGSSKDLLLDVEKTLKIFQAMDVISIARRCAKLTEEILQVARMVLQNEGHRLPLNPQQPAVTQTMAQPIADQLLGAEPSELPRKQQVLQPVSLGPTNTQMQWNDSNDFSDTLSNDNFFANLMDEDILDSFGANLIGFGSDMNFDSDAAGRDMGFYMEGI